MAVTALILLYIRYNRIKQIQKDTNADMTGLTLEKAELEDNPMHELSGTNKELSELPARTIEELSANYHGVEIQDESPRILFRIPSQPVELS